MGTNKLSYANISLFYTYIPQTFELEKKNKMLKLNPEFQIIVVNEWLKQECSISPPDGSSMNHQNFTWVGVDPYNMSTTSPAGYPFVEKSNNKHYEETLEEEEENYQRGNSGLETLSLFPMHEENMISNFCIKHHESSGGWYPSDNNNLAALELTLNSFIGTSPNYP